jgi:glyoxylase-like metal-dependent hydrolase (beta-lactamase superfamily II)
MGYSPVGHPIMSVHFYCLGGLIIDTGQSHMRRFALEALEGRNVDAILLTHHHEDHSGNAAAFHREYKAPVYGHPLTAAKLARNCRILPYQHLIWGASTPVSVTPMPAAIETDQYRLLPIHTPGHSKDHLVYYEETHGWLFAGDLYIGERIKFFRSDENIDHQIRSLQTILAYDFDTLFCAHNPCETDGKRRLARKLDYLREIMQRVDDLRGRGYSEKEIIRRLDPRTDRRVKWITMGNASFANMVRSAIQATGSKAGQ